MVAQVIHYSDGSRIVAFDAIALRDLQTRRKLYKAGDTIQIVVCLNGTLEECFLISETFDPRDCAQIDHDDFEYIWRHSNAIH